MQQALQLETVIDQELVDILPEFKPLLGHRVQMIALVSEARVEAESEQRISLEEFLASRPEWPKDRAPLTLEEMEEGIAQGALNRANL